MKVIVDMDVGTTVEGLLRDLGHDVLAVRNIEILRLAVAESRLLIRMDKDFGELVYHRNREHAGVLLLRLESSTGGQKVNVVHEIFEQYGAAVPGRFSVYQVLPRRLSSNAP